MIEVPYRSLGSIAQPEISQSIKDRDIEKANRLCRSVSLHQLLASSFIFLIIWINIDLLFQLIPNGSKYVDGKWVVLLLGLSRLVNSTLSVGVTVLNYSKQYYYSLLFTFILTVSAIFLNVRLIPIFGMSGAAAASLCSYLLYFALLLWVVWKCIRVSPFSANQWKVLAVALLLLGLNALWVWALPLRGASMPLALGEALLRTSVLCLVGTVLVYVSRLSLEVNHLIDKYILRKQKP